MTRSDVMTCACIRSFRNTAGALETCHIYVPNIKTDQTSGESDDMRPATDSVIVPSDGPDDVHQASLANIADPVTVTSSLACASEATSAAPSVPWPL